MNCYKCGNTGILDVAQTGYDSASEHVTSEAEIPKTIQLDKKREFCDCPHGDKRALEDVQKFDGHVQDLMQSTSHLSTTADKATQSLQQLGEALTNLDRHEQPPTPEHPTPVKVKPMSNEDEDKEATLYRCNACETTYNAEDGNWRGAGLQHYREEHAEDPDVTRPPTELIEKVT
jgi:hypothetical protein